MKEHKQTVIKVIDGIIEDRFGNKPKRILEFVEQAGYVRLAEDQSPPSGIKFGGNPISDAYNGGYLEAQEDMRKAIFRKVEL
jgi:hypothetical protein